MIWNYVIQRPVDIQKIRNRIRKENYRNLEDLESDVMLMCANTQQYNIDGSLVSPKTKVLKISDRFFRFSKTVLFFNLFSHQQNKCYKKVASFQMLQQ